MVRLGHLYSGFNGEGRVDSSKQLLPASQLDAQLGREILKVEVRFLTIQNCRGVESVGTFCVLICKLHFCF